MCSRRRRTFDLSTAPGAVCGHASSEKGTRRANLRECGTKYSWRRTASPLTQTGGAPWTASDDCGCDCVPCDGGDCEGCDCDACECEGCACDSAVAKAEAKKARAVEFARMRRQIEIAAMG